MTGQSSPALGSFSVDPWDPGYGLAFGGDGPASDPSESSAEVNLDIEQAAEKWSSVNPDPDLPMPATVLFLDGVRRIEARLWIHSAAPQPSPGIAASYAAGLVRCDGAARVVDIKLERGTFTAAPEAADIVTRHGPYPLRLSTGGSPPELSLALQQRLAQTEIQLALEYRAGHHLGDDLLVLDGPLRGRTHLERTVGYVKTHHASYLPPAQAAIIAALEPGQRTPVFTMGTSWIRHSWYLRLPGATGSPWSGVVRLECSADLGPDEAVGLANVTAGLLPPLASAPYKDPRAPQNLVPIGGLERELRHRLGDQQLLYRGLREASML